MIITIDGPVATGKSTVAKKLAQAIGFIFFDTGAMYRALTYGILQNHIDPLQAEQLQEYLDRFKVNIKVIQHERYYFIGEEDVTQKIRSLEVNEAVSQIAALKSVRDKFVALQRELAIGVNVVFEGRDMGTVVFPDAALKIFLTGRDDIRAKRRYQEIIAKNPKLAETLTLEKCLEDINRRDTYDSQREHSPLKKADNAYVIDTSDLTLDEIVYRILEYKDSMKTK
jgi:CMP/dCMP kinase